MDTTTLVDAKKDAGAELLRALDTAGFPVEGAFWYLTDETGEWRLAIVTPLLESEGPRATYARLRDVLASHPQIDLTTASIYLFLERDPLYQRLRRSAKTAKTAIERHYVMAAGVDGGSAMIYRST